MQITINGKDVGLKFNNYAVERFAEIFGKLNATALGEPYAYVYAGYLGWKFVKEEFPGSTFIAPVIEFEEVVDWVDSCVGNDGKMAQLQAIRQLLLNNSVIAKMQESEKKSQPENIESQPTSEPQTSNETIISV